MTKTKPKRTGAHRQVAQIVEWIERTRHRALNEVRKACYLIFEAPDASPGAARGTIRFIQFAFEKDWFCMDLPRTTLSRVEAERLRRNRSGFFYVRERPVFSLHDEDANGFDPFRKIYLYGDELTAAEDVMHVFFRVWDLPSAAPIKATSGAFGQGPRFEQDVKLA